MQRFGRNLFVALVTVAIAVASVSHSRSYLEPASYFQPQAFADAKAPVRYSNKLLTPTMEGVDTKKLAQISKKSLKSEPLNPQAFRMIALDYRSRGKPQKTHAYATHSRALSRRDATTILLLIEGLSKKKETKVEDVLSLYDNALTVTPELRTRLYPVLTQIIAGDLARSNMAVMVRKKVSWIGSFFNSAISADYGSKAIVDILQKAHPRSKILFPVDLNQNLLWEDLYRKHHYSEMLALYKKLRNADLESLRDASFALKPDQSSYGAISWQMKQEPDFGAELVERGNKIGFRLYASANTTGLAGYRLLALQSGSYSVVVESAANKISPNASLTLLFQCFSPENELLSSNTISIPSAIGQATSVNSVVDIGADCTAQTIEISVNGGDSQTGFEADIIDIDFRKAD